VAFWRRASRARETWEGMNRRLRRMRVSLEGGWNGASEPESASRSMSRLLAANAGLTNPDLCAAAMYASS